MDSVEKSLKSKLCRTTQVKKCFTVSITAMLFLDIVMFGGIDPVHVPGIDTCNLHWGYRGATEWTCSKKSSPAVSEKYLIFPNTIQIQFKC